MSETATMRCEACGRTSDWNPWGRCSWPCFALERDTPDQQRAAQDAAPEAFAFYLGLAPGRRTDGGP